MHIVPCLEVILHKIIIHENRKLKNAMKRENQDCKSQLLTRYFFLTFFQDLQELLSFRASNKNFARYFHLLQETKASLQHYSLRVTFFSFRNYMELKKKRKKKKTKNLGKRT